MIGPSGKFRNLDGPLQYGNGLIEPAEVAVDRRQDVEAHSEVKAGLPVDRAPLEGLGGPEGIVEGLCRALARGDGVPGKL